MNLNLNTPITNPMDRAVATFNDEVSRLSQVAIKKAKKFGKELFTFASQNKLLVLFLIVSIVLASDVFGNPQQGNNAQNQALNEAGKQAKGTAVGAIRSWVWLVGFVPFGIATWVTWKLKEHLEQKDEQAGGQTEPKASRYIKLIGAFIIGVIVTYILLGVFGKIFADQDYAVSWKFFVEDFWKQILTGQEQGANGQ